MKRLMPLLLIALLYGCATQLPNLDDIDLTQWKADRHGCLGYRMATSRALFSQKEKLLGLTENQILKLLGKPDAAELYKRNQKFYYYQLTADSTCAASAPQSQRLMLHFNATGRVQEVIKD
jgi:hypothetical protein